MPLQRLFRQENAALQAPGEGTGILVLLSLNGWRTRKGPEHSSPALGDAFQLLKVEERLKEDAPGR
jgi:hypothetical protein